MSLRPGYRVRQFWLALVCNSRPVEEAVLRRHLNAEQTALFRRMSVAEQTHALAVLRTLQEDGYKVSSPLPRWGCETRSAGTKRSAARLEQMIGAEPALTQAALLHDVGKVGGRIRLWHRVATVLVQGLRPALLHRLALNEPHSWRYPFFVQLHHAERGADQAAGVGTDSVAVALIRAHHTTPEQSGLDTQGRALLTAFRSADEEN